MNEHNEPRLTPPESSLTNAERFLFAVAYLEAATNDEEEVARLIRASIPEYDFLAGMSVLTQTLYTLYTTKVAEEGDELITFLRNFGNTMREAELSPDE